MDNNGNFEQQFTQNLKATAPAPVPTTATAGTNKLPLVIAIALAAITLVESIVLIITLSNYFSLVNGDSDAYEIPTEGSSDAEAYAYDDDYNLTAVSLSCVAEDGSSYKLTIDNQFEQYNAAGSLAASGPYTITNDNLISLAGSNKVIYFDGFDIADGLTIYTCEEATTEAGTSYTYTE